MDDVLVLPCPCGREIRAKSPRSGALLKCVYCGHSVRYRGRQGPPGAGASVLPPLASGLAALGPSRPKGLKCSSCGAPVEITWVGDQAKDKVGVCPYCQTTVDLPDRRGSTQERVIERPGERITERRSDWVCDTPVSDTDEQTDTSDGGFAFELNGRIYTDYEEFVREVERTLPPLAAKQLLEMMQDGEPAGSYGESTRTLEIVSHAAELVAAEPSSRARGSRKK